MGFIPFRRCAICGNKIRVKERLCAADLEKWKDSLDEPWLKAAITQATYEYNLELRVKEREVPLSRLEQRGGI